MKRLNVAFVMSRVDYGGAETLLVNLIRRMDHERFAPHLCCIKNLGPLGEELAAEIPTCCFGLQSRYDVRVLPWLVRQLRQRQVDAVVTVGAGDKMFWGRLAAWRARVPVIISALHTTGWPDCVGRLNRMLTGLNDAFVGVARSHGEHLVNGEKFPADKVRVIPNGVDVQRFRPRAADEALRRDLGLPPESPVAGIVARLGEEKNHDMFLQVAARVRKQIPNAHYLVIGDGPLRADLEAQSESLGIDDCVHFLGSRADVPELLLLLDAFLLTSRMEANPVSILEALASGIPVVATRVGSVPETVIDTKTGFLVDEGDVASMGQHLVELFSQPECAKQLGDSGRQHVVRNWSLERMTEGYEELLAELYQTKVTSPADPCPSVDGVGTSRHAAKTEFATVANPVE